MNVTVQTCPTCKDTGFVTCKRCEGNGNIFDLWGDFDPNCEECIGKGERPCKCPTRTDLEDCETCEGSGFYTCAKCNGDGDEWGPAQDDSRTCGLCLGCGYEKHCIDCKGKGRLLYED